MTSIDDKHPEYEPEDPVGAGHEQVPGLEELRRRNLLGELHSQLEPRRERDDASRREGTSSHSDEPLLRLRLGRFIVVDILGRGGMGTVFEAYDQSLDRKVALKLPRSGTNKRDARRFVREAQALAKLSHPNVVQVYEVGEVDGQLFIAMELVRGQTLRTWQQQPQPWRHCVRTYLQAGRGLAAAHAVGLVHRDFKPSNCILDHEGQVRVLDFGLVLESARITTKQAHEDTPKESAAIHDALTQTGAVLGTLAYMPPEQLAGDPASERSDQFSFCVSLYEALYGQRPFASDSIAGLTQALLSGAVIPPARGSRVPASLRRVLLRGLSTDPHDRWPMMNTLLDELSRIERATPTRWIVPLFGIGLVGLGLWSRESPEDRCENDLAQFQRVWNDEQRQRIEAAILGTNLSFAEGLRSATVSQLDAYASALVEQHGEACRATLVRKQQPEEVMALRMACLSSRRVALREAVDLLAQGEADVVKKAVDLVSSLPELRECSEADPLLAEAVVPLDPRSAELVREAREALVRARTLMEAARHGQALGVLDVLEERFGSLEFAPLQAEVALLRGTLLERRGHFSDAERKLKQAYELALEHGHGDAAARAAILLVTTVGHRQGRHDDGLLWGVSANALAKRRGGALVAEALEGLGVVQRERGELAAASELLEQALVVKARELGPEHLLVARTLKELGIVREDQGRLDDALTYFERSLSIVQLAYGPGHPEIAERLDDVGVILAMREQLDEASNLFERALEIKEVALGPKHPAVATSLNNLGVLRVQQGRFEDALPLYRRALAIYESGNGQDRADLGDTLDNLGNALRRLGRLDEALNIQRRALAVYERSFGRDHPATAKCLTNIGIGLTARGEWTAAFEYLERALHIYERTVGENHPDVAETLATMGVSRYNQRRLHEAVELHRRALAIREETLGVDHPSTANSLTNLGNALLDQGQLDEALRYQQRALGIKERVLGPDHPATGGPRINLGNVLLKQGKPAAALEYYVRAQQIFERALTPKHPHVGLALARVAEAELELDRSSEAAQGHAQRAVEILEASAAAPEDLAEARFLLAQALWSVRRERPRARAQATQALETYAEIGELKDPERAQVEAWLVKHRMR